MGALIAGAGADINTLVDYDEGRVHPAGDAAMLAKNRRRHLSASAQVAALTLSLVLAVNAHAVDLGVVARIAAANGDLCGLSNDELESVTTLALRNNRINVINAKEARDFVYIGIQVARVGG